jgi:hypothetical protein
VGETLHDEPKAGDDANEFSGRTLLGEIPSNESSHLTRTERTGHLSGRKPGRTDPYETCWILPRSRKGDAEEAVNPVEMFWTICRIPVRPFDRLVKAGNSARPKTVTLKAVS